MKSDHLQEDFGVSRGARREQLAYLLDKEHFAKVPPTFCIEWGAFKSAALRPAHYTSLCSLQLYEEGCKGLLQSRIEEVNGEALRAIMIHNLLCLQLDPGANILVRNREAIPIDYGYSFPERLYGKATTPQYRCEGDFTERERRYITSLSLEECARQMASRGLASSAIKLQASMVQLLKQTVAREGGTLKELTELFYLGEEIKGGGWSNEQPHITFTGRMKALLTAERMFSVEEERV